MTFLYWALSEVTVVQACASSVPEAPPKEAMTSPPAPRRELIAEVQLTSVTGVSPLNMALQPPPSMTKASV